jgi:iron uptake system component EfeO
MKHTYVSAVMFASLVACTSDKTDADYKADVVASMHDSIGADLAALVTAAHALQDAAPTHAWSATADAKAISDMQAAWKNTRIAYEHVEGATAPLFGELDGTMDERYDGYLADLLPDGDQNLFDATGVTGMHGIERILYAPTIRTDVVKFEAGLMGYKAAAYPATDAEAMSFKTVLVQKLIDDANSLHDQWQPSAIDVESAYGGLVSLMNEQQEKVNLAATGEEESRYANITLFDLRNNLAGTQKIYDVFRDWIKFKNGTDPDTMIQARFSALTTLYGATASDALPEVPFGWSSDQPTPGQLTTPFGMLWKTVQDDVNPTADGSVVFEMNKIGLLLGFKPAPEE